MPKLQVFPAHAQQATSLLHSLAFLRPAELQCQYTAQSCLGISPIILPSFTTIPPTRRPNPASLPAAHCWRSRLCQEVVKWGGSEVGRQECMSFWALWVLGTFQSSHAAAKEFSNLTSHPVLRGQQAVVVTIPAGTRGVWQIPGRRLCPLLLLPVSSLLPCTLLWALNSPHTAATTVTELPPSPEESSIC